MKIFTAKTQLPHTAQPYCRHMKIHAPQFATGSDASWDLFRISRSKQVVDLAPNTLRKYHAEGLPFYRQGRAVFASKMELAAFIRARVLIGKPAGKEAK